MIYISINSFYKPNKVQWMIQFRINTASECKIISKYLNLKKQVNIEHSSDLSDFKCG